MEHTTDNTELEGQLVHTLIGVREYEEGYPVELIRDMTNGRLTIAAYNEGHNRVTRIDLLDLLDSLQTLKLL